MCFAHRIDVFHTGVALARGVADHANHVFVRSGVAGVYIDADWPVEEEIRGASLCCGILRKSIWKLKIFNHK